MGERLRNLSDRLLGWQAPENRFRNLDDAERAEVRARMDSLVAEQQRELAAAAFGPNAVLRVITTSEQLGKE